MTKLELLKQSITDRLKSISKLIADPSVEHEIQTLIDEYCAEVRKTVKGSKCIKT